MRGLRYHVRTWGQADAPALFLLHGWMDVSASFQFLVDALTREPSLERYHLLASVRGDLLVKLGRFGEAKVEFEKAAGLTRNERERGLLLERAEASSRGVPS